MTYAPIQRVASRRPEPDDAHRRRSAARRPRSIRAALQALDPSLPVSPPRTLDAVVGASLTQRRFNMTLLIVFAGIALVLAIAGIYGTVAYSVAQRTQEIGIRVALGASSREILGLVLFGALKPVAGGLVVGIVASLALTRALERLVYGDQHDRPDDLHVVAGAPGRRGLHRRPAARAARHPRRPAGSAAGGLN